MTGFSVLILLIIVVVLRVPNNYNNHEGIKFHNRMNDIKTNMQHVAFYL